MKVRLFFIALAVLMLKVAGPAEAQQFRFQGNQQSTKDRVVNGVVNGIAYGARRTFDYSLHSMSQDEAVVRQMAVGEHNHLLMKDMMITQQALQERTMARQQGGAVQSLEGTQVAGACPNGQPGTLGPAGPNGHSIECRQ